MTGKPLSLATHLPRAGVDIGTIQRALGHLRLDSTSFYLADAEERAEREVLVAADPRPS